MQTRSKTGLRRSSRKKTPTDHCNVSAFHSRATPLSYYKYDLKKNKLVLIKYGWSTRPQGRRKENREALKQYISIETDFKIFPVIERKVEDEILKNTMRKQQILYKRYDTTLSKTNPIIGKLREYRKMTFDEAVSEITSGRYDVQKRKNEHTQVYVYIQAFEFTIEEGEEHMFPK